MTSETTEMETNTFESGDSNLHISRGKYNKIAKIDKERLVAAYKRGDDFIRLAEQLGIKRQTVRSIIMRDIKFIKDQTLMAVLIITK